LAGTRHGEVRAMPEREKLGDVPALERGEVPSPLRSENLGQRGLTDRGRRFRIFQTVRDRLSVVKGVDHQRLERRIPDDLTVCAVRPAAERGEVSQEVVDLDLGDDGGPLGARLESDCQTAEVVLEAGPGGEPCSRHFGGEADGEAGSARHHWARTASRSQATPSPGAANVRPAWRARLSRLSRSTMR